MSDGDRILITGAAGFVGGHLLPALRRAFPGATLIAAAPERVAAADATVPLELLDARSIRDCLGDTQPRTVIHLAADASVAESFAEPSRAWKVNVDGTLALAQRLLAAAPETLLVYASSAEIYGLSFRRGTPLDEDAPLAPASPYAATKAAADLALGEMGLRGLRVIRLRPVNHTGRGQSDKFVVAAFARQLARIEAGKQEPVIRVGALDRWRDFLDVRDVCAAYVAAVALGAQLPPAVAINIATGVPRRVGAVLDALIDRVGLDVAVESDAARLRPAEIPSASCDPERARSLLGWSPVAAWDATLDDVLDDWRRRVAAE
jgi:GDP-4-dehydro-6-deoxy-D-mannose reductase